MNMTPYTDLIARFKEYRLLESIGAVIGWDQHTYMPPKGGEHRAEQMGYLAKLGHGQLTAPVIGELLGQLNGAALDETQAVNVREIRRTYDRAVKMPSKLVEEMAKTFSQAQNIWADARKKNDFPAFAP